VSAIIKAPKKIKIEKMCECAWQSRGFVKKKTRWNISGSPSFSGVCDLKSAQKVENKEND